MVESAQTLAKDEIRAVRRRGGRRRHGRHRADTQAGLLATRAIATATGVVVAALRCSR